MNHCEGRQCGYDPVIGVQCGTCGLASRCTPEGICVYAHEFEFGLADLVDEEQAGLQLDLALALDGGFSIAYAAQTYPEPPLI